MKDFMKKVCFSGDPHGDRAAEDDFDASGVANV